VPHKRLLVAIADFLRGPDKYTEAFVDIRARILFYKGASEEHCIPDGFWFGSERHHARFETGDSRWLVIGILGEGFVLPYEGRFRPIEATYETNEKYFELNSNKLEGDRFRVVVKLIGVNPTRVVVFSITACYDLGLRPPDFKFVRAHYDWP
jgi:hypothetical protein